MSTHPIHVFSEIGKLKKVCLHRPGKELENLMPDYLERLLFDDIPFLEDAQKEHDAFAEALRNEGIEVLYLEQLAAESLTSPEIRDQSSKNTLKKRTFVDAKQKLRSVNCFTALKTTKNWLKKQWQGFKKLNFQKFLKKQKD